MTRQRNTHAVYRSGEMYKALTGPLFMENNFHDVSYFII